MPDNNIDLEILQQRLLAPFPMTEMEIKPGPGTKDGRVRPLFYIDARAVSKRLRDIFGIDGFSVESSDIFTNYERKFDKENKLTGEGLMVICSVKLDIHHPLVNSTFTGVGERSVDETFSNKATTAWAQAFKRAATLLGVGEYLYYMKMGPRKFNYATKTFDIDFEGREFAELLDSSLKAVGFKFKCEVTGERVDWNTAAKSMFKFGRVLSVKAASNYNSGHGNEDSSK